MIETVKTVWGVVALAGVLVVGVWIVRGWLKVLGAAFGAVTFGLRG